MGFILPNRDRRPISLACISYVTMITGKPFCIKHKLIMGLKFKDNQVSDASCFTDGCASFMVSGSFAAELTLGNTPEELTEITAEKMFAAIDRLPEANLHCNTLVAGTTQAHLDNYMGSLVKKG